MCSVALVCLLLTFSNNLFDGPFCASSRVENLFVMMLIEASWHHQHYVQVASFWPCSIDSFGLSQGLIFLPVLFSSFVEDA